MLQIYVRNVCRLDYLCLICDNIYNNQLEMNRDIIILCAMMCIAVIFASCGSDSEPVPGENEGQNVE